MSTNDELLASKQSTWKSVSKIIFWGTVLSLIFTLITVLHAVFGPSWSLMVISVLLGLAGLAAATISLTRG
jgi:predicted membrane protein